MYFSGHVTIPGNAEEQMLFLALPLLMMTAFPCLKTLLHYSLNHIMSSIRINLKLLSSSPCSYLNCMSFPLSLFWSNFLISSPLLPLIRNFILEWLWLQVPFHHFPGLSHMTWENALPGEKTLCPSKPGVIEYSHLLGF